MKVLIDTNVLLDVLLAREPWVNESKDVWQACDEGRIQGFISAVSPPNIYYVVRKLVNLERARECVLVCLEAFELLAVDREVLAAAAAMAGNDFEDNLHAASAERAGIDLVVTRDVTGFAGSKVLPILPKELMGRIPAP